MFRGDKGRVKNGALLVQPPTGLEELQELELRRVPGLCLWLEVCCLVHVFALNPKPKQPKEN